jgi:hypothetical protein
LDEELTAKLNYISSKMKRPAEELAIDILQDMTEGEHHFDERGIPVMPPLGRKITQKEINRALRKAGW